MKLLQLFEQSIKEHYEDKYLLNEAKDNVYIPVGIVDLIRPTGIFEKRGTDLRSIQVSGDSIIIGQNWGINTRASEGRTEVKGIGSPSKLTSADSDNAVPSIMALRSPKISNKEIAISIDPNFLNKKMKPVRSDVAEIGASLGKEQVRTNRTSVRGNWDYEFKDKEIIDTKTNKPIEDEQRKAQIVRSLLAHIQKNTEIDWSKKKAEEQTAKEGGKVEDKKVLKDAPERLTNTRDTRKWEETKKDEQRKAQFKQAIKDFEAKYNVKILINDNKDETLKLYDWASRAVKVAGMASGTGAKGKKGEEYIEAESLTLNKKSKLNPTIYITNTVVDNIQRVINDYAKSNSRQKAIAAVHSILKTIELVNVVYPSGMDAVSVRDTLIRGIPEGGK